MGCRVYVRFRQIRPVRPVVVNGAYGDHDPKEGEGVLLYDTYSTVKSVLTVKYLQSVSGCAYYGKVWRFFRLGVHHLPNINSDSRIPEVAPDHDALTIQCVWLNRLGNLQADGITFSMTAGTRLWRFSRTERTVR